MEDEQTKVLRCRICFRSETEEFISLYCMCDTQQQLVKDMMKDIISIDPTSLDGQFVNLPQYVCEKCLEDLNKACTFRKKCHASNRQFRKQLLQKGTVTYVERRCRTCTSTNMDEIISLYCICEGKGDLITDMMHQTIGVARPTERDELPQNICMDCFGKLAESCRLRDRILKSEAALKRQFRKRVFSGPKNSFNPKHRPTAVTRQNKSDIDPFHYPELDPKLGELLSLFSIVEETELYDQVLFSGVICCCCKLLKNADDLVEHQTICEKSQEKAWSKIKCADCNKRFHTTRELLQHREKRDQKLFYRCKICNVLTKERVDLELHFEFTRFHPILDSSEQERHKFDENIETVYEPDNRCCGCDKEFKDGTSLLKHSRKVHFNVGGNKPSFVCLICYTSLTEKRLLMKHQREYGGTRKYICKDKNCQFESDQRHSIKKHVEEGEHCTDDTLVEVKFEIPKAKEYFCCFRSCNQSYPSMEDLEVHCREDHVEQLSHNTFFAATTDGFPCYLCKRTFPKENNLKAHIRTQTERKFECACCGQKYVTRDALARHANRHEQTQPEFLCHQCDAIFRSKYNLNIHIRRCHEKVFSEHCSTCGKCFASKGELRTHIAINHLLDRPWKCSECSMAFGTKPHLKRHKATHTDNRPYKCQYCSNTYRYATDCKRHERSIHLNDKPFPCAFCEARFIRNRDLQLHMAVHTGNKLNRCMYDGCDFTTHIGKQLRAHYETHHPNE
ncbi:zinc finger protein 271-like [Topomyia yanbarensis]|uniref:zinc finger protein 271-like n=1 Tax=Topomyia yanbarensis TaxID=2498891 RepID=UPI00273B6370|nr:zinc finger protein 271-like [Topomyia yanbarensis]